MTVKGMLGRKKISDIFIISLAMAMPAAPAPTVTIFTSSFFFPTTLSAFKSPAKITTAVPCWSSWKMGISHFSFNFLSISKHLGAEISSRLIPEKEFCNNKRIYVVFRLSVCYSKKTFRYENEN